MNEQEIFEQRIRESPEDETLRLVYADWLDEHNEPEYAKALRALRSFWIILYYGPHGGGFSENRTFKDYVIHISTNGKSLLDRRYREERDCMAAQIAYWKKRCLRDAK